MKCETCNDTGYVEIDDVEYFRMVGDDVVREVVTIQDDCPDCPRSSILKEVSHYHIPRNELGQVESIYDRQFDRALRWQPHPTYDPRGVGVDETLLSVGKSTLRRLMEGDAVSEAHLRAGIDYLKAGIRFYGGTEWEPYPGRNAEAMANFQDLLDLLV